MAVANTKATIITNADAFPRVMNPTTLFHGRMREQIGITEILAADDNNSVYRCARLHSSWRISEVEVLNDAITCGADFDLGLYRTLADGGAAVDVDLFADAVVMATARAAWLDVLTELLNIDQREKRIWEMLALAGDPNIWYDLAWTGVAVGTAAGTLLTRTRYVDGS